MRKTLFPFAVAIVVGFGGAAFASEVTGMLKSIDEAAMTVTLEDGTVYMIPADQQDQFRETLSGLKAGDQVQITWAQQGDKLMIEAISPAS